MAYCGPEPLEYAAEEAERKGEWRHAYGFWNEVISEYGNYVTQDRLEYWERHRKQCQDLM